MKDLSLGTSKASNMFLSILSNSFFIICAVSGPQQLLWLLISPLWCCSNFPVGRVLDVSQTSQIATSFQSVVLFFTSTSTPLIVNKARSALRSCPCNLPSSGTEVLPAGASVSCIAAGLSYFFSFWRKKKCFKYFQGGRFYILRLQDILSLGDGRFVQRCGGISLDYW